MRLMFSTLCGTGLAVLCGAVLARFTTLGTLQLLGCGIAIAALAANYAYDLRVLRRTAIRLRVFRRKLVDDAMRPPAQGSGTGAQAHVPVRLLVAGLQRAAIGIRGTLAASLAFIQRAALDGLRYTLRTLRTLRAGTWAVRRLAALLYRSGAAANAATSGFFTRERAEPDPRLPQRAKLMWVSYALLAAWALYEVVPQTSLARQPMEMAAAGASSAITAMATTSAAIRVIGAAAADGSGARHLPAAAAAVAAITDHETSLTTSSSSPRGSGACQGRQCACSSLLDLFLTEAPAKEL